MLHLKRQSGRSNWGMAPAWIRIKSSNALFSSLREPSLLSRAPPPLSTGSTLLLRFTDFWPFASTSVAQLIIFAHLSSFSPFSLFLSTCPPPPIIFILSPPLQQQASQPKCECSPLPTTERLDPFYAEKWQARGLETRVWARGPSGAGVLPGPLLILNSVLLCPPS